MTDPRLDRLVTLPSAEIYALWGFAAPVALLEWDVTVFIDPGESCGQYLALYSGAIEGSACYLGLQGDVAHPATGRGIGKGLIFSTWWSFDQADVRVAKDGFFELGTHEGRFVGIRRPYPWGVGDYRVSLIRREPETAKGRILDWFELVIQQLQPQERGEHRPQALAEPDSIGSIRFPRRDRHRPCAIEPGQLFLEAYSGLRRWSEIPPMHVDVMAYGDGVRCPSGETSYPRPYGEEVPVADVHYNAARERLDLCIDPTQRQRHAAARWP